MSTSTGDPHPTHPLVTLLKGHLNDWNFVEADKDIKHFEDQEWIKENAAFELVPIVVEYLDEEHEQKCPQLVNACGNLLETLATKCPPKEILIALIEHCEAFQADVKFRKVLPALAIVFARLVDDPKAKLALTLDWTLDTLVSHINSMVFPELPLLEDTKEWCALDAMSGVIDIVNLISAFADFLEHTVMSINNKKESNKIPLKEILKCQQLLIWASMEVLAVPMASLNLHASVSKVIAKSYV